jgi:ParB family chromosome partitioning protein
MSRDILLSLIDADPEQPRKNFDPAGIDELAQSMAASGLAVPICVRPAGERFVIVHGERRWRAACQLGWHTIQAEVWDVSAEDAHWLSLIENVQRQDLSPIEEAHAYRVRLADGITQEELGRRIGKSQSYVAQKVRLLKLPADVQSAIAYEGAKRSPNSGGNAL